MKVLITGVSSGIGRQMAIEFSNIGYDIIGVSRNQEKMLQLKDELKTNFDSICLDLSNPDNIDLLYERVKNEDITVLVNNAGFGLYGEFKTQTMKESLEIINTNIVAMTKLTKLFIEKMEKQEKGYILNVSSLAAFMPGPLMASYYASKAYILTLAESIATALEEEGSPVRISVLCPGPVDTDFNKKLGLKFKHKPLNARYVTTYAINQMFSDKIVIIPGFKNKMAYFWSRFMSRKSIRNFNYAIQKSKK